MPLRKQFPVIPVSAKQGMMGSALHNVSVLQHENRIRVHNRGQAVGDHDRRSISPESTNRLLHQLLALLVQHTVIFIQYKDGRVLQKDAGQRDSLLLPSGKFDPPLADFRIVAVGQLELRQHNSHTEVLASYEL
jgi:hypothetical protein